jgi:hypothetical protein
MAHYILLSLVLLLTSQVQQKPKLRLPAPPGSIQIKDNLYLDKTEIANVHWLEYLYRLRQDSSEEAYRRALPDTSVWNKVDKTGLFRLAYLRSFKYRFHPVVGVSYEQAEAYNNWRSARATNAYNSQNKKRLKRLGLENYKVVFKWRLPSVSEWELAAAGGLDPVTNPYGLRKRAYGGLLFVNTIIYDSLGYSRPELAFVLRQHLRNNPSPNVNCLKTFGNGFRYGPFITHPIPFFSAYQRAVIFTRPNPKGFYDTIGNVAEMTAEKGKAKGGSWMHLLEFSKIQMTQTYTAPAAWLGFRSACEVSLEPL